MSQGKVVAFRSKRGRWDIDPQSTKVLLVCESIEFSRTLQVVQGRAEVRFQNVINSSLVHNDLSIPQNTLLKMHTKIPRTSF